MNGREERPGGTSSYLLDLWKDIPFASKCKFASGTISGITLRWALLPFEKIQTDASLQSNTRSYAQLFRENFKLKSLYQLNRIFFTTCGLQTIGKSASNFGVYYTVDHSCSHLNAGMRGAIAAFFAASMEAVTTSYHECKRAQSFLQMRDLTFRKTDKIGFKEFSFAFRATYIRATWSGLFTFVPMMIAQEKLSPIFVESGMNIARARSLATFISAFAVQPFIVPVVNFHTHMLSDPTISFKMARQSFFNNKAPSDYMRGTLARCLHRGLHYPMAEMVSRWLENYVRLLGEYISPEEKQQQVPLNKR